MAHSQLTTHDIRYEYTKLFHGAETLEQFQVMYSLCRQYGGELDIRETKLMMNRLKQDDVDNGKFTGTWWYKILYDMYEKDKAKGKAKGKNK